MDILIVDDDKMSAETLADFLSGLLEHKVTISDSGAEALSLIETTNFDLLITDMKMPQMNGAELLRQIKSNEKLSSLPVVFLTGFAELDSALETLRQGAFDYLVKPVNISLLKNIIDRLESDHKSQPDAQPDVDSIRQKPVRRSRGVVYTDSRGRRSGFFCPEMEEIYKLALKYSAETDLPVLIEGETGCGKEVIAEIVHNGEGAAGKPFVAINCAAISPNLFESELFGYEGGAFTGAKSSGMKGKLEAARGGTLFLDEIGELPLEMQAKLLRVFQERSFYRVGGSQPINVNLRIIAATNRSLKAMTAEGTFRADLYHRLNYGYIKLPPLRAVKSSVGPLAYLFMEEASAQRKKRFKLIHPDALRALENCPWHGNVRELKYAVEKAVMLGEGIELRREHLDLPDNPGAGDAPELPFDNFSLPENGLDLVGLEKKIVAKAMERFNGKKADVARYLGISYSALRSRLKDIE